MNETKKLKSIFGRVENFVDKGENVRYQHFFFSLTAFKGFLYRVLIQCMCGKQLTLPNEKYLDLSKLKAFADDKIDSTSEQKFFLEWVENITGKGENAGDQHFLLFPQCFQKDSFPGLIKVGIMW